MAIKPAAPVVKPAPSAQDAEKSFESAVAHVEHMVDAWLTHKDTTQPQTVVLPRAPTLDASGEAELARRYVAIGWGGAVVKGGALCLTPAEE